ncbi:unnamed protein product [Phaedon cochleariae]|uniref:Gustatory receptor n=1 Tax=Phaedon cochleariae TaxID=80249 RepID=A0A9N9SH30_PHACE|nr:unnamed protein product [Phaedon cochleariae]
MLVFTTMIVMACEELKRSGERVTTTCYILITELEKSTFREDLSELAELTNKLTPKVIASGFYEVNQSLLPTLFSAFVTYLIICIQFNKTTFT